MTVKILSKDIDVLGTDTYRDDNAAVPLAYRATVTQTVNPNSEGTNNQVTLKVRVPVVTTVEGVTVSADRFEFIGKFSALQAITADTERARCLDLAIEYLTKARDSIMNGQLPSAAVTLAK